MDAIDEARDMLNKEKADRANRAMTRINEALNAILQEERCTLDIVMINHSNGAPNEFRFNVQALD